MNKFKKIFYLCNKQMFNFVQIAVLYYTCELVFRFGCYKCYEDNFQTIDFLDSIAIMIAFVHFSINILLTKPKLTELYVLSGLTIVFISILNICLIFLNLNAYVYYMLYIVYLLPYYIYKIKKHIL